MASQARLTVVEIADVGVGPTATEYTREQAKGADDQHAIKSTFTSGTHSLGFVAGARESDDCSDDNRKEKQDNSGLHFARGNVAETI